jgi:hypothetical protein
MRKTSTSSSSSSSSLCIYQRVEWKFIHLVEWRWCDTKYWLIFNDVVIASWSAMKKKMWNLNDIFWVRFSDSIYGWCVWWWWFHWCSAYFPPASIHSFSVIMCMWVCVCVWDFNFFLRKLLLFFSSSLKEA